MGKVFKSVAKIAVVAGGAFLGNALGGATGAKIGGAIGGSLFSGGGGGGGSSSSTSTQQGNTASGAYYDPFASSRQMYADKLNTLLGTNTQAAVDMVKLSPGYVGGNDAAIRDLDAALAKKGMVGSGAEQIAYGNLGKDYFNTSYQNLISQYGTLSGATQQPQSMANANALGASQQRLTDQSTMEGVQALGQLFPSTSSDTAGNASPGGYAAGATSYTPMNTSGSLNNAPNNPYGYNSNPNMGGGTMGPSWA